MKENREQILAERQRCKFWMTFSMIFKASNAFMDIVTTERERLAELDRAQQAYIARQAATLVIQKNLSIKYERFQLLQRVLHTQQVLANTRNKEMLTEGRRIFDSRGDSVALIVTFLRECKTSVLLLARAHLMKIKTVQRYARAFRQITLERTAIISRVLDVFYNQLLVHLHIGKCDAVSHISLCFFSQHFLKFFFIIALHGANTVLGGSRGFDLYAGPEEDALLAEQIDYSIGMIVDDVNLRVTKKMVSPEFHSFIRRFFLFFAYLL